MRNWRDIPGWFSERTADQLSVLIREYEIRDVVEIGSFLGKSAVFFAGFVTNVYCIDPFVMWPEGRENGDARKAGEDFFDKFLENTKEYPNIMPVRMSSVTADYAWSKDLKADMVYIDGSHDYDSVALDIKMFLPRAKKIICGDDYDENWPGVMKAVDEVFHDRQLAGNFWYVIL